MALNSSAVSDSGRSRAHELRRFAYPLYDRAAYDVDLSRFEAYLCLPGVVPAGDRVSNTGNCLTSSSGQKVNYL